MKLEISLLVALIMNSKVGIVVFYLFIFILLYSPQVNAKASFE